MIPSPAAVKSARVKYSCSAIAARRVALPRALSSHDGLLTLFPSHSAVVAVRALQLGRLDELLASPAVKRHAGHLLDGCVCNQSRLRSFWNYNKHILVPDSSPWIDYRGDWVDSGGNNTITEGYVNHTCHTTQAANAAAIITFNGTGMPRITSISSVFEHACTRQALHCTVQSGAIMETTSSASTRTPPSQRSQGLRTLTSSIRTCST
jgi:hypothetical protein